MRWRESGGGSSKDSFCTVAMPLTFLCRWICLSPRLPGGSSRGGPKATSLLTRGAKVALISLSCSSLWANLNLDDVIPNRIEDQLARGVESEFAHDVGSLPLGLLYAQV